MATLQTFQSDGEAQLNDVPPLTASYVQNSVIRHTGPINITGVGSYYSSLHSGSTVTVEGVCRGGTIEANGDVRVKEFVFISMTTDTTETSQIRIKVPAESSIYFDLVHEDLVVQIGKLIYRFDQKMSKAKVTNDHERGTLKVVTF